MEKLRAFITAAAGARWVLPTLLIAGFIFTLAADRYQFINQYTQLILITIGINIILCVSLNLVNGYMGEFSVGHAGFMSLGAYTSAMATKAIPNFPGELFGAVLMGGLVAGCIGFLLAILSFKTRGDYLAIITLAFLMIVKSGLENLKVVGGALGLGGIQKLTSLTWTLFWVVVTIWVIRNLIYSKFGRAVIAIREDEIAANAMGVRIREAKILAFVVSSFFGGVGGALYAHQFYYIRPDAFDIMKSTEMLVMVYLGGVGSLGGSILGASIFTLLARWMEPWGTWGKAVMPALLVLLMLFRPRGIMGMKELPWFLPKREVKGRTKR